MSDDERKRLLESIHKHSDQLSELARRYDRLLWMAEKDASGAFLRLAEAAGQMTESSLAQLATLLDLMFTAQVKIGG